MLFKFILLYLNPLTYLDKHIYELKMINFRLFYKLLEKNLQNLSILISKDAFGAGEFCSIIFRTVWYLSRPTGVHNWTYVQGQPFNCTTITKAAEESTLFLYSVIEMDFSISLKKSFFCLYSELVNLKFY